MFSMPGMREGRRREASSESGFSMGTVLAVSEEGGLASPPPRAKTLVGDPGPLDTPPFAKSAKDGPPGSWDGPPESWVGIPGFVVGASGFVAVWKRSASCWLAKVLEMDSL
jgi:hypothetical protein